MAVSLVCAGCGVNVSNKYPTICINNILQRCTEAAAEPFTVEELIARSLSVLEELMDQFETQDWRHVLDLYYTYWLHRHVHVTLLLLSVCLVA